MRCLKCYLFDNVFVLYCLGRASQILNDQFSVTALNIMTSEILLNDVVRLVSEMH